MASSIHHSGAAITTKIETAKLAYYAATILQKDFGTGDYLGNSDVRRTEIESHLGCTTKRYKNGVSSKNDMETVIMKELNKNRTVMLYLKGNDGLSRAAVIDGYNNTAGSDFYVHINFGDYGNGNDWYALWEDIETPLGDFDLPDRWIMTLKSRR